jgi:hypothetical protein
MATVDIDDFYDYSFNPKSRYGHGQPTHRAIEAILARYADRYEALFAEFTRFMPDFLGIARDYDPTLPLRPHWLNGFFPTFDGIALFGMIATRQPRTYCEIGSGHSTKFAAAAKQAHSPQTTILSVDPAPRAEIHSLCDRVIEAPLQSCDLSIFTQLRQNDIVFLDGSHRVLQNSDVSVFFLEILPMLPPGVLIHIHDIFWPVDYPPPWAKRMYSEQYMLGMLLLFAEERFDILVPNTYVSYYTKVPAMYATLWNAPHLAGIEQHGGSFWFTKR